jgi:hypothetical protein
MSILNTEILTLSEPVIKLDELQILNAEKDQNIAGITPSKIVGGFIPYIVINNFEINLSDLLSFEMDSSNFIPTISVTFYDRTNLFTTRHFPKDGDVISLYIRSNGDELTYKPVRIDFDVLRITPSNSSGDRANKFSLYGQMKVPGLLTERIESYEGSSFDALINISEELGLGFASNIDFTNDNMVWINDNSSRAAYIKNIVKKAYLNDNSFLKVYIDNYYNLTLVEVNRMFSVKDDMPISEISPTNMMESFSNYDNKTNKSVPNILTNHHQFSGTNRFISKYSPLNNSASIFLRNGYKKFAQFYETDEDNFISEFVDPLTTEGTESMIHLKGRYVNGKPEGIADNLNKYQYLGKQDSSETGNVHINFKYSEVLNKQNLSEVLKMGLVVDLNATNMSLYKYQRIGVIICQYGETEKNIKLEANKKLNKESYEDENSSFIINEFLSGYYVINNIKYLYKKNGPLRQRLTLIKREYNQPK